MPEHPKFLEGRSLARGVCRGMTLESVQEYQQEAERKSAMHREGTDDNRFWRGVYAECWRIQLQIKKGRA